VREKEKDEKERQPGAMIIFCNKIKSVKIVYDFLTRQKIKGVEMLHGKMKQDHRESALNNFKAGKLNILCATDVAARGITFMLLYCRYSNNNANIFVIYTILYRYSC
jgi:superfamily II DNA/RNA helicase